MTSYHSSLVNPSSPRTSQRVELTEPKIAALQLTQFSPIAMIQRVINLRNPDTGLLRFRRANTIRGVTQKIVLTVKQLKTTVACTLFSNFFSKICCFLR